MSAFGFDHSYARELPGASVAWKPAPVPAPQLLFLNDALARELGLDPVALRADDAAAIFAGNALPSDAQPVAQAYAGHQFGGFSPQLGDGRALLLGELVNRRGERWEVQLKGAGRTPYSRGADGRAVLRSSLREFVCSEAMHALGVPTTRALALVATGDAVQRDMFYDGNPDLEPGAITSRVAPSFLRFGNFELPAARGDEPLLRALVDYTLASFWPALAPATPRTLAMWFADVAQRTAVMVAHWMRVGFVHGVMNTDNMSILSLTIDYGPFGFLDA